MLNADTQLPLCSGTPQKSAIARRHLKQWLQEVFGHSQAHIKIRLKGNHLHILVESDPSPDAESIVAALSQALAADAPERSLPLSSEPLRSAQIHRLIVYGRRIGDPQPLWTKAIDLNWNAPATLGDRALSPPHPNPDQPVDLAQVDPVISAFAQAQQGEPDAIARYLSSALSGLGVAVRAKMEAVHLERSSSQSPANLATPRLTIVCESAYSPDLSLLRDVIAQRLRELELQQIRDAVVFGQVSGELRPEWVLRVDLTPTEDILKEWARWGDVQAIAQLLNRRLAGHAMKLSALLKESTLHLSCVGVNGTVPDQASAIAAIEPLLQRLLPQGIQAAALYGVTTFATATADSPAWVHWLELSAAHNASLANTTLDLARQGNLEAITFLLTRLVNPDLSAKLATGGIRVQIRQKSDLLHIMTDAPNCPRQDAVAAPIARFLKPLHIASVSGVRVYGRRSGQRLPLWHYGLDFSGDRFVPTATPEFAASDVHVDDLLSPAGALVPWSAQPTTDRSPAIAQVLERTLEKIQRSLIQTQFFIPLDSAPLNHSPASTGTPDTQSRQRLGIGLVWSIVGLLLVLQVDWLLGYWLQLSSPAQTAQTQTTGASLMGSPKPSTATLPNLALSKKASDPTAFNASSFTQPGETTLSLPRSPDSPDSPNAKVLPASPMQAKADTLATTLDYPSFNSRQFDRQLAVYKSYLEIFGAPDVLIIGSSRALRGIDPVALEKALAKQGYTGVQIFNFGINGATAQVVDLLVQHVLPQDKLPKLLLFADGARAFNSARMDITYNGMITSEGYRTLTAGNPPIASTKIAQAPTAKQQPNDAPTSVTEETDPSTTNRYQQVNEILTKQLGGFSAVYSQRDRLKTRLRDQLVSLLPPALSSGVLASSDSLINSSSPAAAASSAPSLSADGQGMIDIDGFLPLPIRFNPVTYYQKYARVSGDYDSDYESFTLGGVQTEAMIAIAKYAQSKKLPLVFVNLPLTQEYLDPARKRHEDAFQQHMLSLAPEFGFIYRDLSSALATQPDYFSDPSHLNRYGAYAVSQRLAQDVMIPWQVTK